MFLVAPTKSGRVSGPKKKEEDITFDSNSIMSLLFYLPEVLNVLILSEWCAPRDVMKLDSAICNELERTSILRIFCSTCFVMDLCDRGSIIRWISIRQVRIKHLLLRELECYLLKFLTIQKSEIVKIDLFQTENLPGFGETVSQFINSCEKLHSIESSESFVVTDDLILKFNSDILRQLTRLDIQQYSNLTVNSFAKLANCCKRLIVLKFETTYGIDLNTILNLIKHNSDLMTLHIKSRYITENNVNACFGLSDVFYSTLVEHCPRLIDVDIFSSHLVSSEMILLCIENLKCLTLLNLKTDCYESFFEYEVSSTDITVVLSRFDYNGVDGVDEEYFSTILIGLGHKITDLQFAFIHETKLLLADALHYCSNLTHFGLCGCTGYSISDLRAVIEGCQNLVSFELSHSDWCNSDLNFLFSAQYSFTSLQLRGMCYMTSDEASSFLDANPRLIYCDISSDLRENINEYVEEYMKGRRCKKISDVQFNMP